MRILITDVTGAVGRSAARQLIAAGHQVSGIASRPDDGLDPEVDFVCASLSDPALQVLADAADVVIHLAPVDISAPGSAGLKGVVHVTDAAGRAGARLLFLSQAAGRPKLYRQAEELVSSGWAPSLVIRLAPPVGRQLDWMVCRTVVTLQSAKLSAGHLRLLHLDDLLRFLVLAVATDRTGVVDLATPDTTHVRTARELLGSVDGQRRRPRIRAWGQLTPELDTFALQQDWKFRFSWHATDAVVDTARGLVGSKLGAGGAIGLPGHLPFPVESISRSRLSSGASLHTAAPDGLGGEFDDQVDPHFPVFSAMDITDVLPGPMSPMTLDVQLLGLRTAIRAIGQVMAFEGAVAQEWERRAIAVFGHHPYIGLSTSVIAAGQLPGWDGDVLTKRAFGDGPQPNLFPLERPLSPRGLQRSAVKAMVTARALAVLRHQKTDAHAYSAAAEAEHCDAATLEALSEAQLAARIRLLRDRIHQGWSLTALWVIDTGLTAATLERAGSNRVNAVSGVGAVLDSERIATETAPLVDVLRRDPKLFALAGNGDLAGIRAVSSAFAADVEAAVGRIGHRGPGEAELANPMFGDDPALLLSVVAATAGGPAPASFTSRPPATLAERMTAAARDSREQTYDTTMRFTHQLRIALRELGSRRVSQDLVDAVDDVYYLTCNELLIMPADARLRIKRRRAERERLQSIRLPKIIDNSWTPVDGDGQPTNSFSGTC